MRIYNTLFCVLALAFCPVNGFGQEDAWVSPEGPAVAVDWDGDDVMNHLPEYVRQVSALIQIDLDGQIDLDEQWDNELIAPKSNIAADVDADADESASDAAEEEELEQEKEEVPVAKPRRALSPEAEKLREQITGTLAAGARRPLEVQRDTPASVIAYCFAYGADTQIFQVTQPQPQPASGQRRPQQPQATGRAPIFAIGALCWNYPSGGKTLLRTDGENIIAKVGPGLQRKPGTLLAMLAMSSIAENYEIRVGNTTGTIADLVQAEKVACALDADMSLALIGLSFYCDVEEEWTNDLGEKWSISKIVLAELLRPADQGTSNITDQLLGLACAVRRFENEGVELTGPMLDAKNYLESFEKFAVTAQNEQGLWHPRFFLFKGSTPNQWDALYSSGHIFRFLAFSLPEEKLTDPQVVRSVRALTDLINKVANTPPTTERQVEALATALHAIAIYNMRLGEN